MRFTRNEYLDLMTFKPIQRQMLVELFGPLVGLEDEWRIQGASEEEVSLQAFDFDYVETVDCGGVTGIFGGSKKRVLEETDEWKIEQDEYGRRIKLIKGYATIALPLDFPVKDWESWKQIRHLFTYTPQRINWNQVERARKLQASGSLVVARIPGAFDYPRELMGDEMALVCYYEMPDLMRDMLETFTETSYRVLEQISSRLMIDQLSVHEDLAGKAGPMVGPRQIKQFFKPYFTTIWDLLSSRGTRIFDMDSDGNISSIIDSLLDCGLNSMHPMEPAAGMDIVAIRKKYGTRLAMRGGIDKHVLRGSPQEIKAELEYKTQILMQAGGIAFGLDHRITNGTPIWNYRYYVDTCRELLGLTPRTIEQHGWARMAF